MEAIAKGQNRRDRAMRPRTFSAPPTLACKPHSLFCPSSFRLSSR